MLYPHRRFQLRLTAPRASAIHAQMIVAPDTASMAAEQGDALAAASGDESDEVDGGSPFHGMHVHGHNDCGVDGHPDIDARWGRGAASSHLLLNTSFASSAASPMAVAAAVVGGTPPCDGGAVQMDNGPVFPEFSLPGGAGPIGEALLRTAETLAVDSDLALPPTQLGSIVFHDTGFDSLGHHGSGVEDDLTLFFGGIGSSGYHLSHGVDNDAVSALYGSF